jgi:hypothetical protein
VIIFTTSERYAIKFDVFKICLSRGLDPRVHVFFGRRKDVGGRVTPGRGVLVK